MLNRKLIGSFCVIFCAGLAAACANDDRNPIKIRARYEIETGSRVGRVVIDCEIPDGHHIYSLQQSSPPGPTKIQIAKSDQFEMTAKFTANREPTVIDHDPVFETRLEQFFGKVSFTAPLQLTDAAEVEKLAMGLTINCQVCSDTGCILVRNKKIEVSFGGFVDPNDMKENRPQRVETGSSVGKDD